MDVREKAVSYLNSRPRTRQELIRHLKDKGFSENEILETVDELEQYHYIDDLAYSRMYFEYGFQKGRGRMRIRRELAEKGVAADVIEIAYEELEEIPDEFETAYSIAESIVRGIDPKELEFAEKRKLEGKIGRRLAGRGFSMDTIHKVCLLYTSVRKSIQSKQQELEKSKNEEKDLSDKISSCLLYTSRCV